MKEKEPPGDVVLAYWDPTVIGRTDTSLSGAPNLIMPHYFRLPELCGSDGEGVLDPGGAH